MTIRVSNLMPRAITARLSLGRPPMIQFSDTLQTKQKISLDHIGDSAFYLVLTQTILLTVTPYPDYALLEFTRRLRPALIAEIPTIDYLVVSSDSL